MGYHSRITGHGFRGLASTVLHEQGFEHARIELQFAHQERDAISGAYNYATYLPQRKKMMQWYAPTASISSSPARQLPAPPPRILIAHRHSLLRGQHALHEPLDHRGALRADWHCLDGTA
jgi:hypothetical protein